MLDALSSVDSIASIFQRKENKKSMKIINSLTIDPIRIVRIDIMNHTQTMEQMSNLFHYLSIFIDERIELWHVQRSTIVSSN